jgi:hypothetical protein
MLLDIHTTHHRLLFSSHTNLSHFERRETIATSNLMGILFVETDFR